MTYRLISTLEQHALIRRDARGRLFIGLGIVHLAAAVQPALRDLAMPVLRRLAEDTGCTSYLAVADGEEVLALAVAEPSWTDLHVAYRIGARHPMPTGASGRAIQLGRDKSTTPYATSEGERYPGARSVAAPIRDLSGMDACIGILTLAPDLDVEAVGPQVVAAAVAIGSRLQ